MRSVLVNSQATLLISGANSMSHYILSGVSIAA